MIKLAGISQVESTLDLDLSLAKKVNKVPTDLYLFNLGPVYTILNIDFDLLAYLKSDANLDVDIYTFNTENPILANSSEWAHIIQGVEQQYKEAINKLITSFIFYDKKSQLYAELELVTVTKPLKFDLIIPSTNKYSYQVQTKDLPQIIPLPADPQVLLRAQQTLSVVV